MAASVLQTGVREAILTRIHSLSPNSPALWGTMDVNGMLCHTADQVRMALGQKETKDISNGMSRTVVKRLVLWGMPIPKAKVKTAPELAQEDGGTSPFGFTEDQKALIDLLAAFVAAPQKEAPHPMFGLMTKKQWGMMIYSHLDHHLRQFGV